MLLLFEEREREQERESVSKGWGKTIVDIGSQLVVEKKTKKTNKNDVNDDLIKTRTWRTPAPDDFQKRLLVILGQVRFRALQPHS